MHHSVVGGDFDRHVCPCGTRPSCKQRTRRASDQHGSRDRLPAKRPAPAGNQWHDGAAPLGQSLSFSPPLLVDLIDNNASLYYCVEVGLIRYIDVKPGELVWGTQTVYEVLPGPVCPGLTEI